MLKLVDSALFSLNNSNDNNFVLELMIRHDN